MHNPALVLENDTHKLLWDFNIQMDHLILARRPDLIIINKKKRICKIVAFAVPVDHRINLKECEKKDKYLDLARELKKMWNMKVTIVPIVICASGTIRHGGLGSWQTGRDYPNDSIAEKSQNPKTSPGDLRRFAVTQTSVKNPQLMLMWKTLINKIKESEKRDKYLDKSLDLARELKSYGTNYQTTTLLRWDGIVKSIQETWLVWFGLVLWHINHCWLFNAKSCFYIYIKYMICKHIL